MQPLFTPTLTLPHQGGVKIFTPIKGEEILDFLRESRDSSLLFKRKQGADFQSSRGAYTANTDRIYEP
ncbi:MAG: hypothetical protein A2Z43_07860 [Syntrophobacterales bacterium RBG_19FT_COMBO_59_10]|nr:MAG: hypothetical protein A2Z43_07860 [Syntrophobacterales bacterium RBG_19FT_COMBO_59_10]